ncbi:lactate utilization protein C [Vibrio tapetis subsp. quintayensis]|uniref:LutC/YkgG family protein n=1 Tax=Vibrio tapetis TaxID=52443 RepID=UPI0025B5DFF6|nr:lactate utilization protein C [Vibrio tapetis]MDN3683067.1 lactate utilization protein C [Vibrio tapetis subsp. quintayensis]
MSNLNDQSSRIHNRESFLNNIANKLQRDRITQRVAKPKLKYSCHHEVLASCNKDELKNVLVDYTKTALGANALVTTKAEFSRTLRVECKNYCEKEATGKQEVLLSADERLLDLIGSDGLNDLHHDVNVWDQSAGYERNITLAERAKVGVVFAEQGLAESGTMVLYSQPKQGRAVSLLPEASIVVVAKSTLFARLTQATTELHRKAEAGERIPSCVNFISGPSSTADIELIKVVGVHGPVYATYIIIDDM